jgi:uncharacterized protein YjbJ (UPF0337 family)
MDRLENAKDKAIGKVMETAGKVTKDQELEFTGKFKAMTTEVKDKFHDVKEDVFQEGNKLLDKVKDNNRNKP